ncbi:MAG: hypothetical protein J6D37_05690 [Clostridia bacterium]|nr:hypothetical protein [Clostridia bacterium]
MIYLERTITLSEIGSGFSSDGSKVECILKAEQFGDRLSLKLSPFHLAPLSEGTYSCLLTDGKEILTVPVGTPVTLRSELSLKEPFCALLCFVHTLVTPVAFGSYKSFSCDLDALLSHLKPKEEVPSRAPEKETLNERTYDDSLLAEENFYPSEEEIDDSYYQSVKDEVEESFSSLPSFSGFKETLPYALFVQAEGAILGKLYQGDRVKYLLFGAKTKEELPKEHRDKAYFVPFDFWKETDGYFLLFQSGKDGSIL